MKVGWVEFLHIQSVTICALRFFCLSPYIFWRIKIQMFIRMCILSSFILAGIREFFDTLLEIDNCWVTNSPNVTVVPSYARGTLFLPMVQVIFFLNCFPRYNDERREYICVCKHEWKIFKKDFILDKQLEKKYVLQVVYEWQRVVSIVIKIFCKNLPVDVFVIANEEYAHEVSVFRVGRCWRKHQLVLERLVYNKSSDRLLRDVLVSRASIIEWPARRYGL